MCSTGGCCSCGSCGSCGTCPSCGSCASCGGGGCAACGGGGGCGGCGGASCGGGAQCVSKIPCSHSTAIPKFCPRCFPIPPLPSPLAPCSGKRCTTLGKKLVKEVQCERAKCVRMLLDAGADPNFSTSGKWRPLHWAAARGHAGIVSLLLDRGAYANATNCYGLTPLHIAAENDYSGQSVLLLIRAGAVLGSRSLNGRTPLHYAAKAGNEAAVRALVAACSSKTAEDDKGKTPFDVAKTVCIRRLLVACPRRSKGCSMMMGSNKCCYKNMCEPPAC